MPQSKSKPVRFAAKYNKAFKAFKTAKQIYNVASSVRKAMKEKVKKRVVTVKAKTKRFVEYIKSKLGVVCKVVSTAASMSVLLANVLDPEQCI